LRPWSGYDGLLDDAWGGWDRSSSSGYGNGAAELDAPGGSGKCGLEDEEADEAGESNLGGVGYLKRSEEDVLSPAGFGL